MVIFWFFGFILICLLSYLHFYKKNYANNQNEQIIALLKERNAKKHENILCTIFVGFSFKTEQFDIYITNNSIILIQSYASYFGKTQLTKRAETYLIIIKEEGFPINLFTNYLKVKSIKKEDTFVIVGDLYTKNPFFTKEFIYSLEATIKFSGIDI